MEETTLTELKREIILDAPLSKAEELILGKKLERIKNQLQNLPIFRLAKLISIGAIRRVNDQNKRQFQRNVERSIGVSLSSVLLNGSVRTDLEASIQNNVNLIQSIQTDYIERIGKVIQENIFSGERSTNLISQIKEQGAVTENRAKFIARDQTAKINADLVRIRAEKIGSKTYVWLSSKDGRVRTDHKVLDGILCSWDDKTVYSDDDGKTWKKRKSIGGVEKHPGEDYQCRCNALPKINWD